MTGCLLSFYQQLKLFETRKSEYSPFRIEKPLLVFVGNRVTASTSAAELTDVEEVLDFLDKFVNQKDVMEHSDELTFADYFNAEKEIYRNITCAALAARWLLDHGFV